MSRSLTLNSTASTLLGWLAHAGFPCNQFGAQEPGTEEDINNFACTKFKATFPVSSPVCVALWLGPAGRAGVLPPVLRVGLHHLTCDNVLVHRSYRPTQLMKKIDVNGANTHPLYQHLKKQKPGVLCTEGIKWNFTKVRHCDGLMSGSGSLGHCHAPGARRPPRMRTVRHRLALAISTAPSLASSTP